MMETPPDWLLSRRRAPGARRSPCSSTGDAGALVDPAVNARIQAAVAERGADAWFTGSPAEFLGAAYDPNAYEKIDDILDVWFDSGRHPRLYAGEPRRHPLAADLYLEGSTSTAAGSSPRCWRAAPPAAARPTTRCSPTASP
jgi:isoleucyl-tRNA synthetase